MQKKITDFILKHSLIAKGDNVLIAVSGGPDSVCLLHVLLALRQRLGIAKTGVFHLDHQLRGDESDKDRLFVTDLCKRWDVPLFIESEPIEQQAKELKKTIEETAREIRLKKLFAIANDHNFSTLCLGHNKDDQAETVLFRLIRGTGPLGSIGIRPFRKEKARVIARPLLCLTRKEIMSYIEHHSLPFRTDSSNYKTQYTRNKLRQKLIPLLEKEYNPGIQETLIRFAELQCIEHDFLNSYASTIYKQIATEKPGKVILSIPALLSQERATRLEMLRLAIKHVKGDLLNISAQNFFDTESLLYKQTGKSIALTDNVSIYREYEKLIFCKKKSQQKDVCEQLLTIPGKLFIELDSCTIEIKITHEQKRVGEIPCAKKDTLQTIATTLETKRSITFTEFCDADKVPSSVCLRKRKPGDRYKPLNTEGSKKIKSIFIDSKIPVWLRDMFMLLTAEDDIFYLIGYRIADKIKVTPKTKNILKIEVKIGLRK